MPLDLLDGLPDQAYVAGGVLLRLVLHVGEPLRPLPGLRPVPGDAEGEPHLLGCVERHDLGEDGPRQ